MDERWAQVEAAVRRALDLPEQERDALLRAECDGDERLLAEARSLLRACEASGDFLETPAPEIGSRARLGVDAVDGAPERIGPYRLGPCIGEGGMGTVHLAEQQAPLRRRVALKLIRLGMNSREVVARFEAERQALALMDHPNIARVYDAGAAPDGRPYFVMEHVPGPPITTWCDEARVGSRDRLGLFLAVCEAVQHAHQKGVIHRDLKPSNVLIAEVDGRPVPKIIDFGVAKAVAQPLTERTLFTEQGQLIGTPEYMSPEQAGARNGVVDTRTDIYSLGVLLYELLVGALPFDPQTLRAAGYAEIQRRIREDEPPRPSTRLSSLGDEATNFATRRGVDLPRLLRELRGDLDWITLRAMEKSPDRRYPSASELAADIRRHLEGDAVLARPPSAAYRAAKFVRRNRALVAGAVAVGGALLMGAAGATWQAIEAARERDRARAAEAEAGAALVRAEEQAAIAEAINRFLNQDLISAASPDRLGRDVTVRAAIDAAAGVVGDRFAGQPHVESAVRTTLGFTYLELGELEKATAHLERALEIHRADEAINELAGALTMHVLGRTYWQLGRLDDAQPLIERALAIREAELGPANPQTSATRNEMAALLYGRGRYVEAAAMFERIHADLEVAEGPTGRRTLIALGNLAAVLPLTGNDRRAAEIVRRLVDVSAEAHGREHPDTLRALVRLGAVLGQQGRFDESIAALEESLALHRQVFGAEHFSTATAINDLAVAYHSAGRASEAEPPLRDALALVVRIRGPGHEYAVTVRDNLGNILEDLDRLEEAAALREENFRIARQSLPPGHPVLADAMSHYALVLDGRGREAEARDLLLESYAMYEAALGPNHEKTLAAARSLSALHDRLGDVDEAALWRARGERRATPDG